MKPSAELIAGIYHACEACHEAKWEEIDGRRTPYTPHVEDWVAHHNTHHTTEIIPAATFLADHLKRGYIDVDRPDLEPIETHLGGSPPTGEGPLGKPGGKEGALAIQRSLRQQYGRPLVRKVEHVRQPKAQFKDAFERWYHQIDVGVPSNFVTLAEGTPGDVTVVWDGEGYDVRFSVERLAAMSDNEIEISAAEQVVKIAAMQRFAGNADAQVTWLANSVAEMLVACRSK